MQKKIAELFENTKADAVLLRNSDSAPEQNFFYFSKLPFGHYSGSLLLLKPEQEPVLIANCLENKKIAWLKTRQFDSKKKFEAILKKELSGKKKIGLNFDSCPKNAFLRLKKILRGKKFVDISKALGKTRETKTKEEIKKIGIAVKISEDAIKELPVFFSKGMTEKQLGFKLDCFLREHGDAELAFPTIVAFGKNSAVPHHITGDTKIKNGLLLVDFGAKNRNYCAELTRMFCIGKATLKQCELYEKVFASKKIAESLCRPNANCGQIFEKTRKFIKQKTGSSLVHGLGHGLGLQAHDFPYGFGEKSKGILKEGMVLTLEPAIYGKFGGIRIEDDILITKNGCKLLSNAPKELAEI
jgi:Xaa-Pro dipeptidase